MIIHITSRTEWQTAVASGVYRPPSLSTEGFIHCSLPEQVVSVANALYVGEPDLVLLVIDPAKIAAEIRYEDCYQAGQEFPHIYGDLPVAAVQQVLPFPAGADGRFTLPPL